MTEDNQQILSYLDLFVRDDPPDLSRLYQMLHRDFAFTDPFHQITGPAPFYRLLLKTRRLSASFTVLALAQLPEERASERHWPSELHWVVKWRFCGRLPVVGVLDPTGFCEVAQDRATGRILRHDDYWDSAVQIYMRLPLLGYLIRTIARHIGKD